LALREPKTPIVLVIESHESFRRQIVHHLRLEACHVIEVCEESTALAILRKKDIDVVLLGLHGFKTTALALLREIKMIRPASEVILMNVTDGLSLSMEAMKLGAFDDLWAPIEMETLVSRVNEAFKRKQRRVERAAEPREGSS
jgi:DNA-binding NtrC family response regulator